MGFCRYEVSKKKGKFDDAIKEMEDRIARNFCHHGRVQCGIVYCLSRNDCEKVAAELQVSCRDSFLHAWSVHYWSSFRRASFRFLFCVLQKKLAGRLGNRVRVRYDRRGFFVSLMLKQSPDGVNGNCHAQSLPCSHDAAGERRGAGQLDS